MGWDRWPVALEDVERPDPEFHGVGAGWYVWHLGEIIAVWDTEAEARAFVADGGDDRMMTICFVADPKTWEPVAAT